MKIISLITIFVSAFVLNTSAQQVIINGKPGERLLVWDDFKGNPDEMSSHAAFTSWYIDYHYGVDADVDSFAFKTLEVTLKFEEYKSWVKKGKGTDTLLKHEQGHFDIGRLCQLEILYIIKKTVFTKEGVKAQFKSLFKDALDKYKVLGIKYDTETNHSLNKEKQEEWNKFLATEKERLLKLQ